MSDWTDEYLDPKLYDEAVARAIVVMEAYGLCPKDWADRIDTDTLEVASTHFCVLSQVFSGMISLPVWSNVFFDLVEINGADEVRYQPFPGRVFSISPFAGVDVGDIGLESWLEANAERLLNEAWVRAIKERVG